MAAANRSWVNIPDQCLAYILRHLPCFLDHRNFSRVCAKWRSIAQQHPARMFPWLLMPSTAAVTTCFCVADKHNHHVAIFPDYARGSRFCGSFPGSWLVASLPESRGHTLLQLLTGVSISLPNNLFTPCRGGGIKCPVLIIHAATLSAMPTLDEPYYVAAVMSSQSTIAFWRPGMNYWTPPRTTTEPSDGFWRDLLPKDGDHIEDVTYYAGTHHKGFHVLTNKEGLLVYEPETNANGELTASMEKYDFPGHQMSAPLPGQFIARYLVQSRGKLLMVVRFVSREHGTVAFKVFVLQRHQDATAHAPASWKWRDTSCFSTLSRRRIFLGRGCSVAVDVPEPCPLYIHFLDDAASFFGTYPVAQLKTPYLCSDTGTFWFFNQQIVHDLPRGGPSGCSRWIWLFVEH